MPEIEGGDEKALEQARKEGEVIIKRKDGSSFSIKPIQKEESPLDLKGVELSLSADEIVEIVREMREK
ncbi:type II toxin-antitoxin system Phd/YefM family antitoxin [Candidatus Parcubacteria bacterium]|nr:MAG: type II toxin-antitoxin system Phd/YefM family antitoxin [Candidatus Parcubacteria bacterium]